MRQYTTPTLNIKITYRNGIVAEDLDFDYVLLTIRCGDYKIEREVPKSQTDHGTFSVKLTQEETGGLKVGELCEIELNVMAGTTRIGTQIHRVTVCRNLHDEVVLT